MASETNQPPLLAAYVVLILAVALGAVLGAGVCWVIW